MKAVSLFSSAGIGELGIKKHDIEIIAANELRSDRCGLYRTNFPETKLFEGDIWRHKGDIIDYVRNALVDEDLLLVYATPPCQGMSTNGAGRLRAEIEAGNRPPEDERNRLVIPAMDVIEALQPGWVLFENVPGMKDTVIRTDKGAENIIEFIERRLGPKYVGTPEVISCADYGIPQLRKRLITIYTRLDEGKNYFHENHESFFSKEDLQPQKSLWDAISHLPPLDGSPGKCSNLDFNEFHYVNCLKKEKYWWVENTPEGETAYNNQCTNPKCRYTGNARHIDKLENGRWVANKHTPIYCQKCGELLPRPTMIDKKTGKRRLIRGFHSAYRRMEKDKPARSLTRNFPFEASDNKIHPTQNRVLSVYEALIIQSIADYTYSWTVNGKKVTRSLIAQSIGESVPPKLIDMIVGKMLKISDNKIKVFGQQKLFRFNKNSD